MYAETFFKFPPFSHKNPNFSQSWPQKNSFLQFPLIKYKVHQIYEWNELPSWGVNALFRGGFTAFVITFSIWRFIDVCKREHWEFMDLTHLAKKAEDWEIKLENNEVKIRCTWCERKISSFKMPSSFLKIAQFHALVRNILTSTNCSVNEEFVTRS